MAEHEVEMGDSTDDRGDVSRRRFIKGSSVGAAAPLIAETFGQWPARAAPAQAEASPLQPLRLDINCQRYDLALDPRTTLLDALREHIGLTGSKKGCGHGQCGACTVLVDGHSVNSCLTLALAVQGRKVTTIEGLAAADGALHPMQQAFIEHDAFQCGYCTSGQIMSGIACVTSQHAGSAEEIREFMSGNLCRCAAYPNIVAAIADAKTKMGA